MEVHAHAHTERKKWSHYIWEFLMLFFAVFCGFLAENQREHMIEHRKEVEYIQAMVEDLKEDTALFKLVIERNRFASEKIDTLIGLLKSENRNFYAKQIYYMARVIPTYDQDLICQDKTFEQLKGSGGLRLIRKQATQNKIGSYYQTSKYIQIGPTPMQYQNRRDLFLSYEKLFDAAAFQEIMKNYGKPFDPSAFHFALLSHDPIVINSICTRFHIMYSTKRVVSMQAERFIKEATSLIQYLKEEYHLK